MSQNLKGPANPRYKTAMCKNFTTDNGCQYGEKCQFAHGVNELRTYTGGMASAQMFKPIQQLQKNIMNYKIVKCKNFEKDGACKYGSHCSFAHGDNELRTKVNPDQQMMMGPVMFPGMEYSMMMVPGMQGMAPGIDYSQMGMDPNLLASLQQGGMGGMGPAGVPAAQGAGDQGADQGDGQK